MKKTLGLLAIGLVATMATTDMMAQKPQVPVHKNHQTTAQTDSLKTHANCPKGMRGENFGPLGLPNLTEAQKIEIKKIHTDFVAQSLTLKGQENELKAKKHTLLSQGSEVGTELTGVITELNNIKTKIDILKAKEQMSIKAALTPEQKTMFNERLLKMGGKKHSMRGEMGRKDHMSKNEKADPKAAVKGGNEDTEDDLDD